MRRVAVLPAWAGCGLHDHVPHRPPAKGVSRLGLVVRRSRLVSGRTQVRFPASRLPFPFQKCDLWTLSRDFALQN